MEILKLLFLIVIWLFVITPFEYFVGFFANQVKYYSRAGNDVKAWWRWGVAALEGLNYGIIGIYVTSFADLSGGFVDIVKETWLFGLIIVLVMAIETILVVKRFAIK